MLQVTKNVDENGLSNIMDTFTERFLLQMPIVYLEG